MGLSFFVFVCFRVKWVNSNYTAYGVNSLRLVGLYLIIYLREGDGTMSSIKHYYIFQHKKYHYKSFLNIFLLHKKYSWYNLKIEVLSSIQCMHFMSNCCDIGDTKCVTQININFIYFDTPASSLNRKIIEEIDNSWYEM